MNKLRKTIKSGFELLATTYNLSKTNVLFTILSTTISTSKSLFVILLPGYLIDFIMHADAFNSVLKVILIFVAVITVADMSLKAFRLLLTAFGYTLSNKATLRLGQKGMKIDFKNWETPELINNSFKAVTGSWIFMGISDLFFENLFSAIISLAVISYIIIQINPLVLIALFILVFINIFIERRNAKKQHELDMEKSADLKRVNYNNNIILEIKYAQETRLYDASDFFINKYAKSKENVYNIDKKKQKATLSYGIISTVIAMCESLLIYLFATYQYSNNILSIGYFLVFSGAITEFTKALKMLLQIMTDLYEINDYYTEYKKYMNIDENLRKGSLPVEMDKGFCFEFINVSFKYPSQDNYIIKNINFTISNSEKIAIVGENGSGKTTIVKLLMRLYDVGEGEIKLNGVNIKEYDYDSYMSIFSPVFQDFQLHAYSIRENIVFQDTTNNDEEIWKALEENEVSSVIKETKHGLDTYTSKLLDEDGCDFSGGEKQKLSIARARYKNTNMFIFDEPTAAIDPISEMKLFERINLMMKEKTVVFVSHRMASTKFADKIIVLKNGEIVESGQYKTLINMDGVYAKAFKTQASFYEKDGMELNYESSLS